MGYYLGPMPYNLMQNLSPETCFFFYMQQYQYALTWIISYESDGGPTIARNSNGGLLRWINKVILQRIFPAIEIPKTRSHHKEAITMEMDRVIIRSQHVRPLQNQLDARIEIENHHFRSKPRRKRKILSGVIELRRRISREIRLENASDAAVISSENVDRRVHEADVVNARRESLPEGAATWFIVGAVQQVHGDRVEKTSVDFNRDVNRTVTGSIASKLVSEPGGCLGMIIRRQIG